MRQQPIIENGTQIKWFKHSQEKQIYHDDHQYIHLGLIIFEEILNHAALKDTKWIRGNA